MTAIGFALLVLALVLMTGLNPQHPATHAIIGLIALVGVALLTSGIATWLWTVMP